MAQRGIREYEGKKILFDGLAKTLPSFKGKSEKLALVRPDTDPKKLVKDHPWLLKEKLVAKPDQLFGKRGKHGLLCLNADFKTAWNWISERMNKTVTVGKTTGELNVFMIEPFTPHKEDAEECYVAIRAYRDYDTVYLSNKGGIYVEENWDKVKETRVPILSSIDDVKLNMPEFGKRRAQIEEFVRALYKVYAEGHFTYLEINPFTFLGDEIVPLDLVARVDDTAAFECTRIWGDLEFPSSFGQHLTKEEEFIRSVDEGTGASLKLTMLNPDGRVWNMVAGGGASVIYADTVCDLGFSKDLANYGEYSGDPSAEDTYQYARTILDLMTRKKDPRGKVLIIGGGIANFTDVAKTFKGIIRALTEYKQKLVDGKVKIYVRRGGPNYKEGLANMRKLGETLGVPIEVYGPETHMTAVVSMALNPAPAKAPACKPAKAGGKK
ncbi:MAG: ATP citrate lyase citrate-binding domain-containing protein [Elusimicrobiales bacterium]|nr:ATP citrate lyase citrate-binding domain-containing protein [Elusimicrobiales bacterium]